MAIRRPRVWQRQLISGEVAQSGGLTRGSCSPWRPGRDRHVHPGLTDRSRRCSQPVTTAIGRADRYAVEHPPSPGRQRSEPGELSERFAIDSEVVLRCYTASSEFMCPALCYQPTWFTSPPFGPPDHPRRRHCSPRAARLFRTGERAARVSRLRAP